MVLAWIAAYTICIGNIIIGFFLFLKNREKSVFALLLIKINVLVTTAFILLNHVFAIFNELTLLIVFNIVAFHYITVPNFIFRSAKVKLNLWKLVFSVITAVLLLDVLIVLISLEIVEYLFYIYGVPFIFISFPSIDTLNTCNINLNLYGMPRLPKLI